MQSWRAYSVVLSIVGLAFASAGIASCDRNSKSPAGPSPAPAQDSERESQALYADLARTLTGDAAGTDRCTSCHVGVANPKYRVDAATGFFRDAAMADAMAKKFPDEAARRKHTRTLRAHPRLDLMVHAQSKHPLSKVSCADCHLTVDRRNEEGLMATQRQLWAANHMDAHPVLRDVPLIKGFKTQAACARCHDPGSPIEGADVHNQGLLHYERSGCYGCHATPGMYVRDEDLPPGPDGKPDYRQKIRRLGPELTYLSSKLTPRFAYNWILHPPAFRPTSRMPPYFPRGPIGWPKGLMGENKHPHFHTPVPAKPPDPIAAARVRDVAGAIDVAMEWAYSTAMERDAETIGEKVLAAALAEYVFSVSKERELPEMPSRYASFQNDPGSVDRGRRLFDAVGCLACHRVDERYGQNFHMSGRYAFMTEEFGPNLVGSGDKFDDPVGKRWLFNWLKDPKRLFPETTMPNFGLTDGQAADLVSFLLSLKIDNAQHPDWSRKAQRLRRWRPADPPLYFFEGEFDITPEARKALDEMWVTMGRWNGRGKELLPAAPDLPVEKKVLAFGEKLFEFLGCYGCHNAEDARRGERDWQKIELPDRPSWDMVPEKGEMQRMPVIETNPQEMQWVTTYFRATYEAHVAGKGKRRAWNDREWGVAIERRRNCAGCHLRREQVWVVADETRPYGAAAEGALKNKDWPPLKKEDFYVSWVAGPRTLGLNEVQRAHPLFFKEEQLVHYERREVIPYERWFKQRNPTSSEWEDESVAKLNAGVPPPTLRMPGLKFTSEFLIPFLKNPENIRPNLLEEGYFLQGRVKMPNFGFTDGEATALAAHFGARPAEGRPAAPERWREVDAYVRETCLKCHRLDDSGAIDAPPLTKMKRFQRDWLEAFLREPSLFLPGTAMPALRKEIQEDKAFFTALVDYLLAYEDVRIQRIKEGPADLRLAALPHLRPDQVALARPFCESDRAASLALLEVARAGDVLADVESFTESTYPDVRRLTIEALAAKGLAVPRIVRALQDRDADVRLAALRSVVRLKAREHAGEVAKVVAAPETTVKLQAMEALRWLAAREHAGAIAAALEDPREDVRSTALDVLGFLRAREHASRIAPLMTGAGERSIRRQALETLGALHAADQAPAIAERLSDGDFWMRAQAALILSEMDHDAADAKVLALREDAQPEVRWAAAVYMARRGMPGAPEAMRAAATSPGSWLTPELGRDGVNELNLIHAQPTYEALRELKVPAAERPVAEWIAEIARAAGLEPEIAPAAQAQLKGTWAMTDTTALRILNQMTRSSMRVAFVIDGKTLRAVMLSEALERRR